MRKLKVAVWVGVLALLFVATLARAADTPARQAARAIQDSRLDIAMDKLQDVITQLAGEDTLSRAETDDLRHQLASVYRQLDDLRGKVDDFGPYVDQPATDEWSTFGNASVRLSNPEAQFIGWETGNTIRVGYGSPGVMYVTVENGPYTARWVLSGAYSGAVHTTVRPQTNGDVNLEVRDERGSHDFVIKDGGLGPVYIHNAQSSPSSADAGVWYRKYQAAVDHGDIASSAPMTWLIQQYDNGNYVSTAVRDLGRVLDNLEGTPLSSAPIAHLRYDRAGRTYELDVPDPRYDLNQFASFALVLYDLDQTNSRYNFEFTR